jgi:ABC-type cobalamin/Fe3+-siderophores transport system ATPase subunit
MKVELCGVKKSYTDRMVLDIESLRFESGKSYAVLGPNGSGKTTMLRLISAIEKADNGTIYYDDKSRLSGDCITYVPQKPYIFDTSVLNNLVLGMDTGTFSRKKIARDQARRALESINMQKFSEARARSLSGGEAQKVAILRALVLGRRLALLDEPTSFIDIPSLKQVEDLITATVKKNKATLILATHNPSQAARMANELIILWEGRIVEKGPCDRVLYCPQRKETKDFLENWTWANGAELNSGAVNRDV